MAFLLWCGIVPAQVPAPNGPGQALRFDGVDDYVLIPHSQVLTISNRFTLEFWFRPASLSQGANYLLTHSGLDDGHHAAVIFGYSNTNEVEFYAQNPTIGAPRPGSKIALPDTNWHHLAYSYDGVNWAGYRDGAQIFSTNRTFSLSTVSNHWLVGASYIYPGPDNGSDNVAGDFDEVRIWNIGRSAAQIQDTMRRQLSGNEAGLVGYWRFDEGGGLNSYDATTNSNLGRLNRGPIWIPSAVSPFAPTVTSLSPTGAMGSSRGLNGMAVPNNAAATSWFEWGTTTNYGNVTPVVALGNGAAPTNWSHLLTGLSPNVTYHYRAVATNIHGASRGADQVFGFGATNVVLNTNNSGPGSLRQIIQDSQPWDTIVFASTVTGTIILASPELVVDKSLTILGPGARVLAVSGNNASRVFATFPETSVITIAGLTIRDGLSMSPPFIAWGGGILNNATLTVSNCLFVGNRVVGMDGAVGSPGGDGIPAQGGAILSRRPLMLVNCTFLQNSAQGGAGGNGANGAPNAGGAGGFAEGGALYSDGPFSAFNCTFATNSAIGGRGGNGGVSGSQGPGGNGGEAAGGQVMEYSFDRFRGGEFVHCTLVGGRGDGGLGGSGGAGGQSGAGRAGGVRSFSSRTKLLNTIIAGNAIGPVNNPSQGPDVLHAFISLGNNFISVIDGSSGWIASDLVGTNGAPRNPLLGALRENGGPTPTIAPLPGSAVIEGGTNTSLLAPYSLATDQRGFFRLAGNRVDIGAVELGPVEFTGISYLQSWLIATVPSNNTFIAQATASLNSGTLPGGTPVTLTVTYELRDETNGLVPLHSNSVSQVVMIPASGSASVAVSLPLAPTALFNSVDHTYQVVATMTRREGAGGPVINHGTLAGPLERFLYFNGRMLFGPRLMNLAGFALSPTVGTPVPGAHIPVTLRQVRIVSGYVPELDFTRSTMTGVQLRTNGDAVYSVGPAFTVSIPSFSLGVVSNVCFARTSFQFQTSGISVNAMTVKLPTGFGYSLGDANGPYGRILQSSFPIGTTAVDDFLRPTAPSFPFDAPNLYYFCEETKPVWLPASTITWYVNEGRFEIPPETLPLNTALSVLHVRRPEYIALNSTTADDPTSLIKKSNDRYFERVTGMGGVIHVRAGANKEALLSASLTFDDFAYVQAHFPYDSRWLGFNGGSSMTISNDLITAGQLGVEQVSVQFDRDCANVNCPNIGNGAKQIVANPTGMTLRFTADGGLLGNVGFTPTTLEWGAVTNGVFVHSNSTAFNAATYHMPGTFLRGDLSTANMDDRPGVLLFSGYGQVNNPDPTHIERPSTAAYNINGLANYAGLNFLIGGLGTRSRSTIAGTTLPDYPLTARSKYYVRYGGVSGIHEPVPGTFPTNLVLYGYNFTFSSFGLAYLDNHPQQHLSICNGSVAVPYPCGFTQDFSKMQITCRGQLGPAELPPGDVRHRLQYWGNDILPLSMDFRDRAGSECDAKADRTLAMLVETHVAHISQPLHGVLGFSPNGNLVPPAAGFIGVDSRFDLPPNLTLKGPSQESYNFTTVAKGYLNNYLGMPTVVPGSGFMNLVGKIDLPFFEDARVHLHTSGKSNDLFAPIHMMGGWRAPEDTRSHLGWVESNPPLHYFNTLATPTAFDPNNWGFPGYPQTGTLSQYRTNTDDAGTYRPRATGNAFDLVALDYPLNWSSTTRTFKSYRNQTDRFLVLEVGSQVKRMTPRNAEITFGAEYSGLPKISIGRLLADGIGEATGMFRSLDDALTGLVKGAGLQQALDQLDRALNDRFDGFLNDALRTIAIDPVVEQLCEGIYGQAGGFRSAAAFGPSDEGDLTGEDLVNYVNAVLDMELQQQLTSAIESTGAGSLIGKVNDIVGEADKVLTVITNITRRDENGVRSVAANIVGEMVQNDALQFAAKVADYELLFGTMQKFDPTLDDILARALEIQKKVKKVQAELNGGFRQELSGILSRNLQQYLRPLADDLVKWVNDNVPTHTPPLSPSPGEKSGAFIAELSGCSGPVAEQFRTFARRRMIERLSASPIATGFQVAIKQRLQDLNAEVRETLDTVFQQLNEIVRDLLESQLAELDQGIASFVGDNISDIMGAGQIQGYASINDDGLRKLRLDGKFRMRIPDAMEFRAYLEILALDSDGSAGCKYDGNKATEVKIGALNVPLDWVSPGIRMDIHTKITSDKDGARGFAGAFALRGKMDFEVVELSDLAATIAFGKDEGYFGGRARARLKDYEVMGGLWFGKSCDKMPLLIIDPAVAEVIPEPGPYVGGYAYAEGWVPVNEWFGIPSSCVLTVRAGVGMGIFFFESGDPPIRTYGGKALFGADAELLCIAHAQLAVRMIGAKIAGDLKLKGRGDVNIEIGSCPFCIEFSAGVNMGLLYGLWYMDL